MSQALTDLRSRAIRTVYRLLEQNNGLVNDREMKETLGRLVALETFVRQIADGKRLMDRSHMTMTDNCSCCGAEERACVDGEDELVHKEWCIVMAARTFFPGFVPSRYPKDVKQIRHFINRDEPQFRWNMTGEEQ